MPDSSLVPVEVTVCPCPGTPHPDGDTVFLYPKISYRGAIVALQRIRENAGDEAEMIGALMETYIRHGVAGWTFTDGRELPEVNPENLKKWVLSDLNMSLAIGNKADDLYSNSILAPLREAASKLSLPSPTNGSTYPRTTSPRKPRRRSKPS